MARDANEEFVSPSMLTFIAVRQTLVLTRE